ncbi:hypothetical protein CERZMDRAFT_80825 [Cercospora zeae-maydis SCOH1-5]|uniref:Uncharacterized protein n=1 Tax=Cercospora zeae-maydis SCOH1-5 TaxID=717836 RepID=A0A6A6FTT9_9PEZI|nr:hypothetical protein CERZMDRAFT_80825 [Cercospora zeae-maydis SCOH1-5]
MASEAAEQTLWNMHADLTLAPLTRSSCQIVARVSDFGDLRKQLIDRHLVKMNFIDRAAAARCFAVLFVSADFGRRAEKAIVPNSFRGAEMLIVGAVNKIMQEKKTEKKEKEKIQPTALQGTEITLSVYAHPRKVLELLHQGASCEHCVFRQAGKAPGAKDRGRRWQ